MNLSLIHQFVLRWFTNHGRDLPWREKILYGGKKRAGRLGVQDTQNEPLRDPYRIIVSELMLQQTQVDRVLPKFHAFLTKWPTVQDLARAELREVLIAWQGLGYNRRARFLHEMAKVVTGTYGGNFPQTELELRTLPGVGEYTARAILAFAFGHDVGVSDTNVQRIFARVLYGQEKTQTGLSPAQMLQVIDSSLPVGQGEVWHQALMDLGAMVCTSKAPKCEQCPLQTLCSANQRAIKQGQKSYADLLAGKPKPAAKPRVKFEDTDRYFRGRVIDKLREGSIEMADLYHYMCTNHGLADKVRWGVIIEGLMIDKLIRIERTKVRLG